MWPVVSGKFRILVRMETRDRRVNPAVDRLLSQFPFDLKTRVYEKSYFYSTPTPSSCKSGEPVVVGVDEAGRGPVLGPMVYAVAYCPVSRLAELASVGFADSKVLTEAEREHLFLDIQETLSDWIGWAINALHPKEISASMLRKNKYNLNALAHDTTISLLRSLLACKVNVQQVFVDTVGPPEAYEAKLKSIFPGIAIRVSKKADSLFPIVSAASICAKVPRDLLLRHWRFSEGADVASRFRTHEFGSGYPSDEKTITWLKSVLDPVFGFPLITRFSWGTAEKLLESHGTPVFWPEILPESAAVGSGGANTKVTAYFVSKPTIAKKRKQPLESKDQTQRPNLVDLFSIASVQSF